ncbi:MAG: hypothetical protein QGI93_13815 [Planctomycetota bacterium]|jgi:lysophospholipase L1-like esterase|nr:hypothetical protein [Planctomycetota bacterium]MDP6387268.1 hypothetical protein [Planctomycetota bacterium]
MIEPLLWSLAVLAFLLLLAEIFLRCWYRLTGATYVWPPHGRIRLEIDRATLPNLDPVARIEFNRDGERGPEPPRSWEHNGRVLVVGGSAAECYMLDQERTWPAVLQRELNRPQALAQRNLDHFHVGSISRSLVPCEALLRMLQAVHFRYPRLDWIVLMVGASDVVRWLQQGTPSDVQSATVSRQDIFALHATGPFGWRPRQLALRRALAAANERLRRPVLVKQNAGQTITSLRAMRADADELLTSTPDPSPMVESFATDFTSLLELAQQAAKRVLVVRQPWFAGPPGGHTPEQRAAFWNFGRGNPYLEQVDTYYDHDLVNTLFELADATQARIAAERGVQCISLQDQLPPDLSTWYDYNHLAPQGAERVGQLVAQAMMDREDGR